MSFDARSPELERYLRVNHIGEIFEALLAGLFIMRPKDPFTWCAEKLKLLFDIGYIGLEWDVFIEKHMKPSHPFIDYRVLQAEQAYFNPAHWEMLDAVRQIIFFLQILKNSLDNMALAIKHVNRKLKQKCIWNWIQFVCLEKKFKIEEEALLRSAIYQYRIKFLKKSLKVWRAQTAHMRGIKTMARVLVKHVKDEILVKQLFREWWSIVVEAKRTREYFERLEMGNLRSDSAGRNCGEYSGSRQEIMTEAARRTIESELRNHIASLPQDLQIMLFSYLNPQDLARCSMVCRSWRAIVCDLSDLPVLNCSQIPQLMTNEALKILAGYRKTFLRSIDLRGTFLLRGFNTVAVCKNLQELSLAFSLSLTDEDLRHISFQCVNLLKLDISGTRISDNGLRHLATNSPNLQILNLSKCGWITEKSGDLFLPNHAFPNLVNLNISDCSQLQPKSIINMCHGNRIRHWFLNHLNCVNDEVLERMSGVCMDTLELRDTNNYERNLSTIATRKAPTTQAIYKRSFSPAKVPIKRAHTTHQLVAASTRIQQRLITDNSLAKVLGPQMNRLIISGLKQITDNAFKKMSTDVERGNMNLKHFECSHCPKVGDSLTKFISGHRNLVYLKLSFCDRVTDTTIKIIGDSLYAQTLRELYIDHCPKVTDLSMMIISKRLGKLAHLSLAGCVKITDQGFEYLANLTQLASLNVSKSNFADSAIANVAAGCTKLRTLLARACIGVTDIGLQKFAHLSKYIECLDLSFCKLWLLLDSDRLVDENFGVLLSVFEKAFSRWMQRITILESLDQEKSFEFAMTFHNSVAKARRLKRSFRLKFLLTFMDYAREKITRNDIDIGTLVSILSSTLHLISSRVPLERYLQNVYFVMKNCDQGTSIQLINRFVIEVVIPIQNFQRLKAPILIQFCVNCLSKYSENQTILQLLHDTLVFEGGVFFEFSNISIMQQSDIALAHQRYLMLPSNGRQSEQAIFLQLCLFEKLDSLFISQLLIEFEHIFFRQFQHYQTANLIKFISLVDISRSDIFNLTLFYLERIFNSREKLQILKNCSSSSFWNRLTNNSAIVPNILESFPHDGNLYRFPAFALCLYKVLTLSRSKLDCNGYSKKLGDFNHFLSIHDHGISLPNVYPVTMTLPE